MKTLQPLTEGSGRTVLSADVANTLIGGANAIRGMRGGNGVQVTQAAANIRVDLGNGTSFNDIIFGGCPIPADFTLSESFAKPMYAYNYPLDWFTTPPFIADSNHCAATETWNLSTYFPYQVFADGSGRYWNALDGSIVSAYYPQSGWVEGGTFRFSLTGYTSGGVPFISTTTNAIAWNASAATVQSAISGFGASFGGLTVSDYTPPAADRSYNGWAIEYSDGLRHGPGYNPYFVISDPFIGAAAGASLQKGGATLVYSAYLPNINSWGEFHFSQTNQWRDHASGSLTIGPYAVDMMIFAVTDIYAVDGLFIRIDSGGECQVGGFIGSGSQTYTRFRHPKDSGIKILRSGSTARLRCTESNARDIYASGIIGVKPIHCCPRQWIGGPFVNRPLPSDSTENGTWTYQTSNDIHP